MHDIYSRGAVPCKSTSAHNLMSHKNEKATPDELEPLEVLDATNRDVERGNSSEQSIQDISIDVSTLHQNSETEEEQSPP